MFVPVQNMMWQGWLVAAAVSNKELNWNWVLKTIVSELVMGSSCDGNGNCETEKIY